MTQEEFAKQIADKNSLIERTKNEINNIRAQYIKENAPYNVGDKVKVEIADVDGQHKTVEYGFVKNINVDDDGKFMPDLYAMKKDGTANKNKYLWAKFYKSTITRVD